ncbi:MAG: hypothetical protein IE931_10685 [Sphingobacteriales bacterium]|nr:hypothetical protein [Sphingobacteriales bacterium]
MRSLLIHPENLEQMEKVKDFLNALNVKFEDQEELPEHIVAKLEEGLAQYEKGNRLSVEEFRKKYFTSSE